MTAAQLITKLEELVRMSPQGLKTEVKLETPYGLCQVRDLRPEIESRDEFDYEGEPVGVIETEPAAFVDADPDDLEELFG